MYVSWYSRPCGTLRRSFLSHFSLLSFSPRLPVFSVKVTCGSPAHQLRPHCHTWGMDALAKTWSEVGVNEITGSVCVWFRLILLPIRWAFLGKSIVFLCWNFFSSKVGLIISHRPHIKTKCYDRYEVVVSFWWPCIGRKGSLSKNRRKVQGLPGSCEMKRTLEETAW